MPELDESPARTPSCRADSPFLKTLIDVLNPPRFEDNCPKGTLTK